VTPSTTYADQFVEMLSELGYTHCFFVAGGNIMHLLNSVRTRMTCVPFVHEVSAGIAAEYFNEVAPPNGSRAFALVTAGPGLTNIITAMAGAWLESRELLVVGGQVKSTDLSKGHVRQRGIQEVDGINLAESVCKQTLQINKPIPLISIAKAIQSGSTPRKGPIFIEICLDVQGMTVKKERNKIKIYPKAKKRIPEKECLKIQNSFNLLKCAKRPVILIGGGVSRGLSINTVDILNQLRIPMMTTWNGADRVSADLEMYFGRPNTWGQRSANLIIQQSDLVIAVGTRLGLQQTGFNWQSFCPMASIVHVDIDSAELSKGHPLTRLGIQVDADTYLSQLIEHLKERRWSFTNNEWLSFCKEVRDLLPLNDPQNNGDHQSFVDPYELVLAQSLCLPGTGIMLPCSSGGPATVTMQAFEPKASQRMIGNKSLASMGYGLAGAIGVSLAEPTSLVILNEGDGGFAQNLPELGTLERNGGNVKVFLWSNDGYASIRMTQRNYFSGQWIGCDTATGLGLPDWKSLAAAYRIRYVQMNPRQSIQDQVSSFFQEVEPLLIEVPIDPQQTYFPKISSHVTNNGLIVSAPLHEMSPPLEENLRLKVTRYLR
jgi:acetolactate synthase-1/2/3 large subunit